MQCKIMHLEFSSAVKNLSYLRVRSLGVHSSMCKDAQKSCKFDFSVGMILGLTVKLVKQKNRLVNNFLHYFFKIIPEFLMFFP